jgi:hypothetical protein
MASPQPLARLFDRTRDEISVVVPGFKARHTPNEGIAIAGAITMWFPVEEAALMDHTRSKPDGLTEKTRDGDRSRDADGKELMGRGPQDESPDDAERTEESDAEPREASQP